MDSTSRPDAGNHSDAIAALKGLSPSDVLGQRMIFVCGASRSGTSMMGTLLGLNDQVRRLPELHFFEEISTEAERAQPLERDKAIDLANRLLLRHRHKSTHRIDTSSTEFRSQAEDLGDALPPKPTASLLYAGFLAYICALRGKPIPCDHTPRNVYYLREILGAYPNARVIVMVRDARDVLASQKHRWKMRREGFNQLPRNETLRLRANYHPVTMSLLWKSAVDAGDRYASDGRVHVLRFEDLLADGEREVSGLCDFIGLTYSPSMIEVPQVKSTFSSWKVDKRGLNPESAGRWARGALTSREIYLCERWCRAAMARHSYARSGARPSPAVAWTIASFPVKAGMALAANRFRTRNFREAARRRLAAPPPCNGRGGGNPPQ